ncbi:glycosyl hydrolase 115 family protein [Saccharibacillus endophyticus]|uniref:Glycosyl hydrolase family 115 n=1 Tax=Saccharibacillus endophyticus TaxID=2060666 RepID=A0ABQ1ZNW2_9BACL|nr:glycosyl hydrolase 115 family protein [Saccharibacillus endophyticus]GGH70972.1 hypothetical protein GCM10007362_07620 [Saccharibacillus endophyticus]
MSNAFKREMNLSGKVLIYAVEPHSTAIAHVLRMLKRDLTAVLGIEPEFAADPRQAQIRIGLAGENDSCPAHPEAFEFRFVSDEVSVLHIVGRDELGVVYGVLAFSRKFLGIQPFWYWMDQEIKSRSEVMIPCVDYASSPRKVRYRGWFVNDEVCLIGWKPEYPPTREVWEPVFEALLRSGGNMVIPGTDLPRHGIHYELASEMGLWVTHHHAEPLGAEMFARAYPGREMSYLREPERYEQLWRQAIEEQRHRKVVWVLSFRGQGDKPFWEDDPSFDTPFKRGELIGQVMQKQYDMIREYVEDPVCCVALYGEIAELYQEGWISLPENTIRVWADNGYGKMVSRRRDDINLRIPSLPGIKDSGRHGLYIHVTFHDLQASNHLTMFAGSADFLKSELEAAFAVGASDYLILNSGNIRPHAYPLDIVSTLWNEGTIDTKEHLQSFVRSYYVSEHEALARLYHSYAEATLPYGPHPDDLAGEQYYHHPARQIIGHWLQGKEAESDRRLDWAVGAGSFEQQVKAFEQRLAPAIDKWKNWLEQCDGTLAKLGAEDRQRAEDHLRFHGELHLSGSEGFYQLCRSYAAHRLGQYPQAFVLASESLRHYRRGLDALRAAEHGKWADFYRADWLTNIASTVQNVDTLRKVLRMHGDSPDFFLWYKQYLMPETEKHIYLENTHREPLTDDDLAARLKERLFTDAGCPIDVDRK